MVSILLVAAIGAVGGCKPSASDEAKAKQVASKALPGNPLVGIWKSQPGGKANDQPSTGLAMTFERDGTMQMTRAGHAADGRAPLGLHVALSRTD